MISIRMIHVILFIIVLFLLSKKLFTYLALYPLTDLVDVTFLRIIRELSLYFRLNILHILIFFLNSYFL
jgi:hypothetical protein